MSILHSPALLQGINFNHDSDRNSTASRRENRDVALRPKSSLANLIHFVRNPVESASGVIEHWQDGCTKEERARKQSLEDKKQVFYVRLREV